MCHGGERELRVGDLRWWLGWTICGGGYITGQALIGLSGGGGEWVGGVSVACVVQGCSYTSYTYKPYNHQSTPNPTYLQHVPVHEPVAEAAVEGDPRVGADVRGHFERDGGRVWED